MIAHRDSYGDSAVSCTVSSTVPMTERNATEKERKKHSLPQAFQFY